jgi:hypothetical protein
MCLLLVEAGVQHTAFLRKKRLVAIGAARVLWHHLALPTSRRAVEAAERYADEPGWPEVGRHHLAARRAATRVERADRGRKRRRARPADRSPRVALAWVGARVASPADLDADDGGYVPEWLDILHTLNTLWPALGVGSEEEAETHHARLIRDVFPNPARPVAIDPAWRTADAVALARGMYESRDFAAMPILADALQDAGCDDEQLLGHCRGPGPHVRGCWVVDLVLGKE